MLDVLKVKVVVLFALASVYFEVLHNVIGELTALAGLGYLITKWYILWKTRRDTAAPFPVTKNESENNDTK